MKTSNMDWEKKYKEALEWARKVMQGKVGFVLDEVLVMLFDEYVVNRIWR